MACIQFIPVRACVRACVRARARLCVCVCVCVCVHILWNKQRVIRVRWIFTYIKQTLIRLVCVAIGNSLPLFVT